MGILGLVLMVTGASLAQASTVANQTTSHTAAVTEHPAEPMSPAQLLRLSHLHALHVAHLLHLAHLARLAELARQAEYAQKLAAEKTTLAADAQVPATNSVRYQGTTSMQQCIINAESGGNPYIWNASGHWGLYQFSYGTWVAHGGVAADFGHAGPAEQTAVFWQTVHDDGYTDWTPYDGC